MSKETTFHLDVILTATFGLACIVSPWFAIPAVLCGIEAIAIGRKL